MTTDRRHLAGLAAIIVLAALALGAPAAQAHTTVTAPGAGLPFQQWVDEARVPTPPVAVEVVESACPYAEVLACTNGQTIWDTGLGGRASFDHELGHVFEALYLTTPELQGRVLGMIGHPRLRWAWQLGQTATASEAFADSYSLCARLPRIRSRWRLSVGSVMIDGSQLRRVCRFLRAYP